MVSCYPGAAFVNGQRSKIFTKLDIAIKPSEPGTPIMFTGKKGFIPAKIAQVPIQPSKPTTTEKETAGAAEATTEGAKEMETEEARPSAATKYVWSAVAADGTTKKLDPKTDLIPVLAADGDYELGLANYCPYHAANGLLLHKGITHT